MPRGASMSHLQQALLLQRVLTIALSGYNACFFLDYARRSVRRRLGAGVLACVNLALGGESLAFGLLPSLVDIQAALAVAAQIVVASLSLAVTLVMAVLALRHRLRNKR